MESLFKRWMNLLPSGFNISNVRGILSTGQILLGKLSNQVFMHSLQKTWSQGVWRGSTTTSWQMEHINSPSRSIWSFSGNLSISQPIVKLLGALLGVSFLVSINLHFLFDDLQPWSKDRLWESRYQLKFFNLKRRSQVLRSAWYWSCLSLCHIIHIQIKHKKQPCRDIA